MTDSSCTTRARERHPEDDDGDVNDGDRTVIADGDATSADRADRSDESTDAESEDEPIDDESADDPDEDVRRHLRDVPAGSGCTEIWEHLSESREDDE